MLQARAQALFAMDCAADAATAGEEAVRIREKLGEPGALAEALTTLAPIEWALYRPADAIAIAMRAVGLLSPAVTARAARSPSPTPACSCSRSTGTPSPCPWPARR
jgi:hypothetical protein